MARRPASLPAAVVLAGGFVHGASESLAAEAALPPTPARLLPAGERLTSLAESFPTLRGVPGVRPWDAQELDRWAHGPQPSEGGLLAAQFCLAVWNGRARWSCGAFDLVRAVATWDEPHRRAFAAWAADPWLA